MRVIFPSLVLFALASGVLRAQTAQTSQSEFRLPEQVQPLGEVAPPDGGDLFIQRVADTCNQLESVQARIHFQADLFDQHTIGSGIYLQQGRGMLASSISTYVFRWPKSGAKAKSNSSSVSATASTYGNAERCLNWKTQTRRRARRSRRSISAASARHWRKTQRQFLLVPRTN